MSRASGETVLILAPHSQAAKGGIAHVVHLIDIVYSDKHRLVYYVPPIRPEKEKISVFYPNGKKNILEIHLGNLQTC